MKENSSYNYLITGYTDAKGNALYNLKLSKARAKSVVDALVDRGVSSNLLRYRGVGSRISFVGASGEDVTRRGDRKVSIEIIENSGYWDLLQTTN